MFIFASELFYLLTAIITIMKELRNVDVYYCKLCGQIESLRLIHLLLNKSYFDLISSYQVCFTMSDRERSFWKRFISNNEPSFSSLSSFSEYCKLLKRHDFWLPIDLDYLEFVTRSFSNFIDWLFIKYNPIKLPF